MTSTFARRLMAQSILLIGGSLTLLMFIIALLGFFSYVEGLNTRIMTTAERIPQGFRVYNVPRGDPSAAARAIAKQTDIFGLRIATFNSRIHVYTAAADPRSASRAVAFTEIPNDRPSPPTAATFGQQLSLGLALALGLHATHLTADNINVDIGADAVVLAWTIGRFLPPFFILLAAIWGFAYFAASLLNREALRPLDEVVAALETFASGDLNPRRVTEATDHEFGRLATAYNAMAEQLSTAFAERDHAEEEMRRFIADAAHQLRTPLTVIQGFIGIMRKNDVKTEADRERILESMDRQGRSMAAAIAKLTLLDHWEAASAQPQLLDVGVWVADLTQPVALAYPDRFSFTQQPACYAFFDPSELREALENVIDNAVKYGGDGPVAVLVSQDERSVHVSVADHGPGFSDEDKQHAFERFYRGEQRSVSGSGLGLAIAKRAVERAGGSIDLKSELGAGTQMTITLPRGKVTS